MYSRKVPLVLGLEFSGIVTEIGTGVTNVKVGDRVAVEPILYCGHCEFYLRGDYNLCKYTNAGFIGLSDDGGFAEYVVTDVFRVHKLPDNLTLEEGALVEPTAVAIHDVRKSGLRVGQTSAIFGAGPIDWLTNTPCCKKSRCYRNICCRCFP